MKINPTFLTITKNDLTDNAKNQDWLNNNKLYNIIGFTDNCIVIEMDIDEYQSKIRHNNCLNYKARKIFKYDINRYELFLLHIHHIMGNKNKKIIEYFKNNIQKE